jgi:diguanylate cyclase (GGDEF)-like protein/putative nucleotidyltransferase with HDIG domain
MRAPRASAAAPEAMRTEDFAALARAGGVDAWSALLHPDDRFELVDSVDGLSVLLGLPPESVLSVAAWREAVHPADRDRYDRELGNDAIRAGRAHCIYRVVATDGRVHDVQERIVITASLPDGVLRVAGMVGDVTATYGMHRRARALTDQLKIVFWDVRFAPDGSYRSTSPESEPDALLASGDAVFLGGSPPAGGDPDAAWRACVHPDDVPIWEDAFLPHRIAERDRVDVEYRLIGFDGVERTVREMGVVRERFPDGSYRLEGVVIDVSDERAAARALDRASQRLARIAGSAHAYGYDGDIIDGRMVEPEPDMAAMEAFLGEPVPAGVDEEDFWISRIVADDRERYAAWYAAGTGGVPLLEYRMMLPDGRVRMVADWAFASPGANGYVHVDGVVLDVTESVEARRRASDVEHRLATVLAGVDLLVATLATSAAGARGERFRGPGTTRVLGSGADASGDLITVLEQIADPRDRAGIGVALATASLGLARAEHRFRIDRDGEERWLNLAFHPRRERDAGEVLVDCICTDITADVRESAALVAARDDAERRLNRDELTGVGSRPYAVASLTEALANPGRGVAVALYDIDHFKRVNDTFLHQGGDAVLVAIGDRFARAATGGLVARYGGEEFLVVFGDIDAANGYARTESLRREASREPIGVGDDTVRVTLSAGLAWFPGSATAEQALDAADRALHAAKRRGRDRLVEIEDVEPEELIADDPDTLRLAQAMSEAVAPMVGETERHCAVVSRLAGEIAAELGLGAVERLRCRIAGMLHDVGKIAVPPEILSKPGALTAEERGVLERHAEFGARIVQGIGGLADAAQAILHHHEWYDGRGYPTGLAGGAIPIEARIIAAVDAWSAMIEPRVYRAALAPNAAAAELERCSGTQFDPLVITALGRVLERSGPLDLVENVA